MSYVTEYRCDQCGKKASGERKGWTHIDRRSPTYDGRVSWDLDACSVECEHALLAAKIDSESRFEDPNVQAEILKRVEARMPEVAAELKLARDRIQMLEADRSRLMLKAMEAGGEPITPRDIRMAAGEIMDVFHEIARAYQSVGRRSFRSIIAEQYQKIIRRGERPT